MEIEERLQAIATRIPIVRGQLTTEEATKTSLVLPFIQSLGYDFTDPDQVVPEFHADVPGIKGERVDYAIMQDGAPIIMFECKAAGASLGNPHHTQLYRYFGSTTVRVGVLTNGILYEFYSDLDDINRMDAKPFMTIDMSDLANAPIIELERLCKGKFNESEVLSAAAELKYNQALRRFLKQEFTEPGDEFSKMLIAQVYQGKVITQKVRDTFAPIVRRSLKHFIADQVNERLRAALSRGESETTHGVSTGAQPISNEGTGHLNAAQIESEDEDDTTVQEIEGFLIVKSLLRGTVAPARVAMRDQMTYCGILLDDNNRHPLCRLWFNRSQRYVGLFDVLDESGKAREEKVAIETLDDIYGLADRLIATASRYVAG